VAHKKSRCSFGFYKKFEFSEFSSMGISVVDFKPMGQNFHGQHKPWRIMKWPFEGSSSNLDR
jgi:hypothetical protein